MTDLHIRAILAGALFGIWPLLMNKSGLSGNVSSAAFCLGALAIVSPFALYGLRGPTLSIVWSMLIGACICGGLGLLAFNGMLSKATPKQVGNLFVLMIVVQVAIPALYQIYNDGGLAPRKALGFLSAIVTVLLLL